MERWYLCSIYVLLCDGGWDSWIEAAWKHLYVLAATLCGGVLCAVAPCQPGVPQDSALFDSFGTFGPVNHYFSGCVTTDTAKWSAMNQRIFFPTACKGWKTSGRGWSSGLLDSCVSFWVPRAAGFCQGYLSLQCCHPMKIAIFSDQLFCVELIHAATYREILQFLRRSSPYSWDSYQCSLNVVQARKRQ